jgi:hypothetical protein
VKPQLKGEIAMAPHDAEFWAQGGSKARDKCHRFAQNPNFVSLPDDWQAGSGHHALHRSSLEQ